MWQNRSERASVLQVCGEVPLGEKWQGSEQWQMSESPEKQVNADWKASSEDSVKTQALLPNTSRPKERKW